MCSVEDRTLSGKDGGIDLGSGGAKVVALRIMVCMSIDVDYQKKRCTYIYESSDHNDSHRYHARMKFERRYTHRYIPEW